MLGRSPRPPLLARVPLRGESSLDRESLDAMLQLWSEIGPWLVLITGREGRSELADGLARHGTVALMVDADNQAAIRLYRRLGLSHRPMSAAARV